MTEYQHLNLVKLPDNFRGRSIFVVQLWWIIQSTLFGCSPQFMYGWRNLLLRAFGSKVGNNVKVRPTVRITFPWKVKLGDYCRVGDEVVLYSLGTIKVGSHSVISQRSYLCAGSHDYTDETFQLYTKPVTIGEQVWVAADVFVGPGVKLGDGCVIGARSSVFNDMPEGMVCYGYPAKPIKRRLDVSE
ncbi:MAG: colanic acid biosynthesis acetyltransferase WcaF [Zetaproteobacteria bacterium]|nr:colanic acid biosynthesis acetyltransferase WcaF [Zetaproteobacteria bacterium]